MTSLADEVGDVLAAVERESAIPEVERDTGAPTSALLAVADHLAAVNRCLAAGDRVAAEARAQSAARVAIEGWNLQADLTNRVVELAHLIAR